MATTNPSNTMTAKAPASKTTPSTPAPQQFEPQVGYLRPRQSRIAFWKPFQGKGAAATLEYSYEKACFFLMIMPENPDGSDRKFNPDAKITAKIGLTDVGEMIAVLRGYTGGLGKQEGDKWKGLFHKNTNGNTIINLFRTDTGYRIGMSAKHGSEPQTSYSMGLTIGEGVQMELFLTDPSSPIFAEKQDQPD